MRRKPSQPLFPNRMMKVRDILDEDTLGTYRTQAITDDSHRRSSNNTNVPSDLCVEENKEWVDQNHK